MKRTLEGIDTLRNRLKKQDGDTKCYTPKSVISMLDDLEKLINGESKRPATDKFISSLAESELIHDFEKTKDFLIAKSGYIDGWRDCEFHFGIAFKNNDNEK